MANAVYGLIVKPRHYRCDVCNDVHLMSTNHTGPCYPVCPHCSWRSGTDSEGNVYRADIGKMRPHYYVGPEVTPDEYNPHAPCRPVAENV